VTLDPDNADRLLRSVFADAEVHPKRFPSRGIDVVKRLLHVVIRAAHFGFYDLLLIHFDLDDTLLQAHEHVANG
jgi:hypothetical protein